jgi:hypothetical protein
MLIVCLRLPPTHLLSSFTPAVGKTSHVWRGAVGAQHVQQDSKHSRRPDARWLPRSQTFHFNACIPRRTAGAAGDDHAMVAQ